LNYDHAFNAAAVPFGFAHSCFIFALLLLKKLSRPRTAPRNLAMGADNWRSRNVVQHTAQLAAGDIICLLLLMRRIAIRLKYSISYAFDHLNPRPFKCTTLTHFASPPSQSYGKKLFLEAFVLDPPFLADLRFRTRRPSRMSRWPQLSQPASFTIDAHLE
jgi:hypothetical protein